MLQRLVNVRGELNLNTLKYASKTTAPKLATLCPDCFGMRVALFLMHAIPWPRNPNINLKDVEARCAGVFSGRREQVLSISLVEAGEVTDGLDEGSLAAAKEQRLRELLRDLGSVVVAYSGGVDSSYVAYIANDVLRGDALCVTGDSPSLSAYQREQSAGIAQKFSFRREVIETNELKNSNYTANESSRCYFCKDELYEQLQSLAGSRGFRWIVDGSTVDDVGDYRPGRVAAVEHEVKSPLIEVGMTKAEVRLLSRKVGLPTWDQPASPCLSSRIAYGLPVTVERLSAVERGEEILREMGLREFRVRHHDNLVRLEIARSEMSRIMNADMFVNLSRRFRELGFKYVTLDLDGFRSGAMNEVLVQPQKLKAT